MEKYFDIFSDDQDVYLYVWLFGYVYISGYIKVIFI